MRMIKLEISEQQFEVLSNKKLGDVVTLMNNVVSLKEKHPDLSVFLDKFLSNQPIDVIYHGGSNAGSQRRIVPQSIKECGSFRAFCVDSDVAKSFKLERVELV